MTDDEIYDDPPEIRAEKWRWYFPVVHILTALGDVCAGIAADLMADHEQRKLDEKMAAFRAHSLKMQREFTESVQRDLDGLDG